MLDYVTLKIIWWVLVGVLLMGFAIMDGHDMGVGTLLPWVAKTDDERRVVINTVGPHWDGNQVWFITAGGAIFAAWPIVYATAFSGFYWAMLAVLWALFFRPVGFDYRSKLKNPHWRKTWDWGLFIGGFVPSLLFGVALGNVLQGVPFQFAWDLRLSYQGSFWQLLNPFALLAGVVSAAMLTQHGAHYLLIRTTEVIYQRSQRFAYWAAGIFVMSFVTAGFCLPYLPGWKIIAGGMPAALPNPLAKVVVVVHGGWLENFYRYPLLWLLPVLAVLASLTGLWWVRRNRPLAAFVASSVMIMAVLGTFGSAMFPFVLPSTLQANSSLTVWDAASSQWTLQLMLIATLIFLPLIVWYTRWAYRVMAGKVTTDYIRQHEHSAY